MVPSSPAPKLGSRNLRRRRSAAERTAAHAAIPLITLHGTARAARDAAHRARAIDVAFSIAHQSVLWCDARRSAAGAAPGGVGRDAAAARDESVSPACTRSLRWRDLIQAALIQAARGVRLGALIR